MVYMGRYADRDTLQGKLDQLKCRKVEAEDVRSLPEPQPGLNLGSFDNKPAADAALARLLQRGVHTARVITLRPAQTQTVLRLPAADAALRGRLAGLRLAGGLAFGGCAGAGAGARAPFPAASAAFAAFAASAASASTASTASTAEAAALRAASR